MDLIFEKHKKTIVLSLSTVAALTLLLNTFFKKDKNKLPTVPYVWPVVGSTLQYYKNPNLFTMTSTLNHGRSFRVHLHGRLTTVVGAKIAADVLRNPNMSFLACKLKYIGPNFLFPIKSIIFPKGIVPEIIKKHLVPNLDIYGPRSYKKLLEVADANIQESYVAENLLPFIRDMVSRSNATAFIGSAASQREDLIHTFKTCVNEISVEQKPSLARLIFPFINSLYLRLLRPQSTKIAQHKQNIRNAIVAELDNKNKMKELGLESEEKYLIDYILETYPYEINDDYIDSLTYVITMFVFVGIHTTTEAANHVLYRLMLHTEYIEELRQEQEEIFSGQPDAEFVPALSKKMVKLDSFIREVFRCRLNVLGFPHKHMGTDDLELSPGVVIHPGQEVFLNLWQISYLPVDDAPYNKNLDEFQGFRFLETDKSAVQIGEDYLTFGLGKRACPGRWSAIHQIKGMMSVLLRNYNMTPIGTIQLPKGRTGFTGAVKFTKRSRH